MGWSACCLVMLVLVGHGEPLEGEEFARREGDPNAGKDAGATGLRRRTGERKSAGMTLRSSGRKASATGRKTGGEKPKSRSGDRRSRETQEGWRNCGAADRGTGLKTGRYTGERKPGSRQGCRRYRQARCRGTQECWHDPSKLRARSQRYGVPEQDRYRLAGR